MFGFVFRMRPVPAWVVNDFPTVWLSRYFSGWCSSISHAHPFTTNLKMKKVHQIERERHLLQWSGIDLWGTDGGGWMLGWLRASTLIWWYPCDPPVYILSLFVSPRSASQRTAPASRILVVTCDNKPWNFEASWWKQKLTFLKINTRIACQLEDGRLYCSVSPGQPMIKHPSLEASKLASIHCQGSAPDSLSLPPAAQPLPALKPTPANPPAAEGAPQRCSWRGEETVVILVTIDHDWSLLVYRSPDILWQAVMCSNLPEWTLPNAESTTCTWLNFGSIAVQAFRFLNGFSSGQTIHPEADIEFWWLRTSWRTYKRILNTRQRSYIDPYANFFHLRRPPEDQGWPGPQATVGQPSTSTHDPDSRNLQLAAWHMKRRVLVMMFSKGHASFPIWCA